MEALLYEKLDDLKVRCDVCNNRCVIFPGKRGICGVRENIDGTLFAMNYNKAITTSVDPIEKKPLYEFLPRTGTYSFATVGCNFHCAWCQNASISQASKPQNIILGYDITPEVHVQRALKANCPSISYTYSEPTIFIEYALETMKLAKLAGLKNVWVSNGYMTPEALELILPYLDAANIDYKGSNEVYLKYCGGNNVKILENMKKMKDFGVHLEVTTLLVTDVNDKLEQITKIATDLIEYLGKDFIWHLTRFFPHYQMNDRRPTNKETLLRAKEIANKLGIKKIYLGNI